MRVAARTVTGLVLATTAAGALSQSTSTLTVPPTESDGTIEEILVVGARMPRPVRDVVGTVDVITRSALLERIAVNAEDAVRYTPGVSLSRASARFGGTEFTIRGLSGNRVTALVDNVPVGDQFDIGAFANAGQDYFVPGSVSRIEILRGPASTLFGSDALGGVVAVITRDPQEYLRGARTALSADATYAGVDDARRLGGALAGRHGAMAGVLQGEFLEAGERDAAGTDAEEALDRRRRAGMLKLEYDLGDGGRLRFKAAAFDESVESRPETVLGYGRQFASTTYLAGDDQRTRHSAQVEYELPPLGWAQGGRLLAYGQRSRTDQRTEERRSLLDPPVAIERRFVYDFEDAGAIADFDSRFDLAGLEHRLGWGANLRRSEVTEARYGKQRDLQSGDTTTVLLGEDLPVRDFPDSTVVESAAYLHDEIDLGQVTVIPGLRLEHYRLDARADTFYREDYPEVPVEDLSDWALVPKLALQWRLAPTLSAFAQYAQGFRAPPFEDVNIGLSYSVPFPVRAIPNPDLVSETSDGIELGVDYSGDRLSGRVAWFGARYEDFIESKASLGFDPASGALLFQSRNIDRAQIHGVDLALSARLSDSLELQLQGNWTRGENRVTNEPLNSVDPPSLAARLHWQPSANWRTGLAVRAVAAQDRVDESDTDLFQPGGYTVVDLTAGFTPHPRVRIFAGIFNLTDRTYWNWASVRGRPEGDPLIEVLAAPGRYGAVSIHLTR